MTEKAAIQKIVADWKKLEGEPAKEAFLKKVKAEVDAKTGQQLLQSAKAIKEVVHDLHAVLVTKKIEVFPVNAAEATLIENLLERMRVKFRVA
ncbi:MAG: hypothetical protein HY842_11495 [Bacteroidetes bacterium]|nr:hypothetical protein [Bacteroidota bacterium]